MANRTTKKTDSGDGAKWLKVIVELQQSKFDEVPKGYLTMKQLSTQQGRSLARMTELVRELGSRVEMKSFKIKTGSRILPVPHYRLRG